jgi:hypothetical protein
VNPVVVAAAAAAAAAAVVGVAEGKGRQRTGLFVVLWTREVLGVFVAVRDAG